MLHPSYTDLINVVNKDIEPGEQPVVQSRYSIVIAAAKRARQILQVQNLQFRIIRTKSHFPLQLKNLWTEMLRSFQAAGCG